MTDYVVDSSVVVKWVLPEIDSDIARQFAGDVVTTGHRLLVLDLVPIEAANAIWKLFHRKLISISDSQNFLNGLARLPLFPVAASVVLKQGCDVAWKYDRSVYDSLFVALADHLQLPGITADEPLWNAVKSDFPRIELLRNWVAPTP